MPEEEEIIMPSRLAVCEIAAPDNNDDTYRAVLQDICIANGLSLDNVQMPDSDPTTGIPQGEWAFCMVSGANINPVINDSRVVPFPNVDPDVSWSSIAATPKSQLVSALSDAGFDVAFTASADSFGDVLTGIGQQISASFDIANFRL